MQEWVSVTSCRTNTSTNVEIYPLHLKFTTENHGKIFQRAVMKVGICNTFLVLWQINQELQKSFNYLFPRPAFVIKKNLCFSVNIPNCRCKDDILEASKNILRWTPIKSHLGLNSSSGMSGSEISPIIYLFHGKMCMLIWKFYIRPYLWSFSFYLLFESIPL